MVRIEANTLEDAYEEATQKLECSITKIHIDVVQNSSNGFLGFFKKKAIIEARRKNYKNQKDYFSQKINNNTKKEIDLDTALEEIKTKINILFSKFCLEIDSINVQFINKNLIFIKFSGEDSALLIGKDGYRYKATLTLLQTWINSKYGFNVKLEILDFLDKQEKNMDKYLLDIIEQVEKTGFSQTKNFDPIIARIEIGRASCRERVYAPV